MKIYFDFSLGLGNYINIFYNCTHSNLFFLNLNLSFLNYHYHHEHY
jgi:hypothetical protein